MSKLNKRIKNERIKTAEYIAESKELNKILQTIKGNIKEESNDLMFREVITEKIVSTYKNKIGDNPENIKLLVELLNKQGGFYFLEAACSAGKTYTSNDIFNQFRTIFDRKKETGSYKKEYRRKLNIFVDSLYEKIIINEEYKKIISGLSKNYFLDGINCYEVFYLSKDENSKITDIPVIKESEEQRIKKVLFIEIEKCKNGKISKIAEVNEFIKGIEQLFQAIVTPNRIQNIQNEEEENYNFTALIGSNGKTINLTDGENYSAVIEKLEEAFNDIKEQGMNTKINLIIDEAHILVQQKNFRGEAIDRLLKVVSEVLKMNGNVFFMTGTNSALKCFKFDKIINFIQEKPTVNADKIVIYANKEEKVSKFDYVLSCINEANKPLVRYNSKADIKKVKESLELLDKKVYSLTSEDKEINKETKDYVSPVFKNIVKNNALIDADAWITTSVLEVGTNITGVINEGEKEPVLRQEEITPMYVINTYKNCNIDSMVQFAARIRYKVPCYAFITNYHDNEKKSIISIDWFLKQEIKAISHAVKKFECTLAYYMKDFSKEDIILNINQDIKTALYYDGTLINNQCIYFNEEKMQIEIDLVSLYKNAYDKYNEQFYYNTELLAKKLKKEFGISVEFKTIDNVLKGTKDAGTSKKQLREDAKVVLSTMNEDELQSLSYVAKGELNLTDVKDINVKKKIDTICAVPDYVKSIKRAALLSVPAKEIAEIISKTKKEVDIINYLDRQFYVDSNNHFLKYGSSKSIEQDIVLNKFYICENGKMKQPYINREDIIKISKEIKIQTGKKAPTVKEVYKLIQNIFCVSDLTEAKIIQLEKEIKEIKNGIKNKTSINPEADKIKIAQLNKDINDLRKIKPEDRIYRCKSLRKTVDVPEMIDSKEFDKMIENYNKPKTTNETVKVIEKKKISKKEVEIQKEKKELRERRAKESRERMDIRMKDYSPEKKAKILQIRENFKNINFSPKY